MIADMAMSRPSPQLNSSDMPIFYIAFVTAEAYWLPVFVLPPTTPPLTCWRSVGFVNNMFYLYIYTFIIQPEGTLCTDWSKLGHIGMLFHLA
jgi:hypothetical protein